MLYFDQVKVLTWALKPEPKLEPELALLLIQSPSFETNLYFSFLLSSDFALK